MFWGWLEPPFRCEGAAHTATAPEPGGASRERGEGGWSQVAAYAFLGAAFLAAAFLGTTFLAGAFFTGVAFLAAGFVAAGFLAEAFFAGVVAFLGLGAAAALR